MSMDTPQDHTNSRPPGSGTGGKRSAAALAGVAAMVAYSRTAEEPKWSKPLRGGL